MDSVTHFRMGFSLDNLITFCNEPEASSYEMLLRLLPRHLHSARL